MRSRIAWMPTCGRFLSMATAIHVERNADVEFRLRSDNSNLAAAGFF